MERGAVEKCPRCGVEVPIKNLADKDRCMDPQCPLKPKEKTDGSR